MKKFLKMFFGVISWLSLFVIMSASAELSTVTGTNKVLFDMNCSIQEWATPKQAVSMNPNILYTMQSGLSYQTRYTGDLTINSGSENFLLLKVLGRKWYTKINSLDKVTIGESTFTIILWEKCGHPEVNINGRQYNNDMGVLSVQQDNNFLNLYYYKDGRLNAVSCDTKSFPVASSQLTKTTEQLTSKKSIKSFPANSWNTIPSLSKDPNQYLQMKEGTLYDMVKQRGYNWSADRANLANQAGSQNYQGTKAQNLQIKNFLLSKVKVIRTSASNIKATQTKTITILQADQTRVEKMYLRKLVNLRGYIRQKDRVAIAKEFGIAPKVYRWILKQNLKIRDALLSKIQIKK